MYEQGSFEPVARVVQLASHIEQKRLADIAYETRRFVRIGESEETINQRIQDKSQPLINIYHYHCNHLGTPQELSDEKGDIVWLSYDRAWGGSFDSLYKQQFVDNFAISENELQPFKFQGQTLDIETGLHYNRFRYYDSDVGMFVSRDPIELLGGNNTFQYAPNPTGWTDPYGLNRVLIRYVSKVEAKLIKTNHGFVQNIGANGKLSKKAIWVNDGSNWNPTKSCYRVKVTLNESGSKLMDKDVKDISEVDYKETGHPLGVLTKKNEIGAKGIGIDLLPKINKNVIDVEVEQYNKREKKWQKCIL